MKRLLTYFCQVIKNSYCIGILRLAHQVLKRFQTVTAVALKTVKSSLLGAALLTLQTQTIAAPQLAWIDWQLPSSTDKIRKQVDVRQVWEAGVFNQVRQSNEELISPEEIWKWPQASFSKQHGLFTPRMHSGERYIARFQLLSETASSDLILHIDMPRMDAVHMSYRHEGEPDWFHMSAGDTLPMHKWWTIDRQPVFNLPLRKGQTDVVVQIAHRGNAHSDIHLENDQGHRKESVTQAWVVGILIGIQLLTALLATLMSIHFRLSGFLGIALITAAMTGVLFFSSGLGGMYVGTSLAGSNDQLKLIFYSLWCLSAPVAASLLLGTTRRLRWLWLLSVGFSVIGMISAGVFSQYALRDHASWFQQAMVSGSIFLVLLNILLAWYLELNKQWLLVIALLLYTLGFIIPSAAFLGLVDSDVAGLVTSLICTIASIMAMLGLHFVHRMGRQVLVRAQTSTHRDVLTGLLNRPGFTLHLQQLSHRLKREPMCALVCCVSLGETQSSIEEYGLEGLEMGMVQIAASLTTSGLGLEGLARTSAQTLIGTRLMGPDPHEAARMAQIILSRSLALADHGAPLASGAYVVLGWLPLHGMRLDLLDEHIRMTLHENRGQKRIIWIGGGNSYQTMQRSIKNARVLGLEPAGLASAYEEVSRFHSSLDAPKPQDAQPSLQTLTERIRRIEHEMLDGIDTQGLLEKMQTNPEQNTSNPMTQDEFLIKKVDVPT